MTAEQIVKALECHLSVGRDCYQATCPLIDDEKCRVTLKNVVMTFVKDMLSENRGLKTALETMRGVAESYEHQLAQTCTQFEQERASLNAHNENLWKENKYLRDRLAEEMEHKEDMSVEFTCVFGQPHKVSDCPITEEIDKAKADTVKKMQELINERCIEGGIYPAFVANTIDQIAKEILEGTQND